MIRKHPKLEGGAVAPVPMTNPETEWDEIAESSWESFPASDPPAWAGQGSSRLRDRAAGT